MKTRTSTWLCCSVFSVLLILAVYAPVPSLAAEVWSDDFDDENYDDWTVTEGEFTCADGYLEATEHTGGFNMWSGIYHNSTVTSGTWSFDYFRVTGRLNVNLMTDERKLTLGYNLFIRLRVTHIEIVRYTQGDEGHGVALASLEILEAYDCWTHIDVTIDESWNIQLFVNGTHCFSHTLLFPTSRTMQYFGVSLQDGIGMAVDNIVVSDTLDVECTNESCELDHFETTTTTTITEETTTTTTGDTTPTDGAALPLELIAIGGGISVVVIVLIIFLKRKG